MAYVIPPVWITGHVVTAAELNQYLNANLAALKAEKVDAAAPLAANIVTTNTILNANVTLAKLAANSVDSSKIVDGAVTGGKLAAGVALGNIPAGGVAGAYLADEAVTLAKLAANSVDASKIVDGSVTLAKMAANSVDSDQYVDGSIDLVHMSANSVDGSKIVDGAVTAGKIANASVGYGKLQVNTIDTAAIIDGAVTLAKLAASLLPYLQAIKVNGLYFSTEATNPATSLGYGTWVAYAAGRIPIGVGTSDAAYGAGATGGASTHTNTVAEMATHTHVQNAHNHTVAGANSTASVSITGEAYTTVLSDPMSLAVSNTTPTNQNAGSGTAYNNMPPWIGVYIFRRTA